MREGRSLEETPTWSVATVTTVMVFVCLSVERSIYRFGKWLKKTKRKALYASLEKIKEELMLLGLISLLLGQWARWISQICVNSSLFNSRFFVCSEEDYGVMKRMLSTEGSHFSNETDIPPKGINNAAYHGCGEGREPFVSAEGLEQLHRFLFVLGFTHVLYSCLTVALSMSKIYSWRKWETQVMFVADGNAQAMNRVMRRQSTFALHHASHPWNRNRVLIWMLCFVKQFRHSVRKSDYLALRLGFITNHKLPLSYNFHKYMVRSMEDEFYGIVGISWSLWSYAILCIVVNIHGLNIYFWLSFIPAILVMLVGTKLQHVVSLLALEIVEPQGPSIGAQVKPRDDLFWFGKPEILLRLVQFISFQNAFEVATFIWSLWGFKHHSCLMKNHAMIVVRLSCGVIVQFWCSYSIVPLNVIITQMGSRCKKALIAESVRESLHSWCKRVKERSKTTNSITTRSTCSLESTIDEGDEIVTVASGTLSPCSSSNSLTDLETIELPNGHQECSVENSIPIEHAFSFRDMQCSSEQLANIEDNNVNVIDEDKTKTLLELLQKT
ncbi:MLO-like protein 4 [Olea europaea var. sylvestris]|uniref:MLO-like protein 4 n=1 Tax=Olea europaea var. sylvestris TaxID=158386 RepID=UPI000C1D4CFA|nr:MLO-like protein 4 [Olea europaea var. sylvestris]